MKKIDDNQLKISRRNFLISAGGTVAGLILPGGMAYGLSANQDSPSQSILDAITSANAYMLARSTTPGKANFSDFRSLIHPDSVKVLQSEQERLSALNQLSSKSQWNGIFDKVSSAPRVLSATQVADQIQLVVQDWIEISWRANPLAVPLVRTPQEQLFVSQDPVRYGLNIAPNTPISSGFGTTHLVTMVKSNGQWVVLADGYFEPILGVSSLDYSKSAESKELSKVFSTDQASNLRVISPASGNNYPEHQENVTLIFDYQAAVSYALQWESGFNSAYPNYSGTGTDCANFVSQALKAGGHPLTSSWTYTPGTQTSTYDWCNNVGLRNWLISSGRGHDETASMLGLADCVNYK